MVDQGPRPVSADAPPTMRHFLLLQGPCGRFYSHLQRALEARGCRCTRIALNGGDLMSGLFDRIVPYRRSQADWSAWLEALAGREAVTDLVCYGDCRPYHRQAIDTLRPLGINIHVLEEGYLRPHWVTCEASGVNGHSDLTRIDLDRIDQTRLAQGADRPEVELRGSNRHYMVSGFLHYFWTLLLTPAFPRYVPHRELDILGEAALWFERFASWPARRRRATATLRILERLARPLHLVLLQLNGDSQLREHSAFQSVRHFAEFCIAEFAAGSSSDSLLVFKNHPLDNGVVNLRRVIREEAGKRSVAERVFYIDSGKLVPLLERAVSVTAINSTAVHQSLLRGIPTMVLGRAVVNHPQIVARMRLRDFFRLQPHQSADSYRKLVALMRQTCQFNGGFYSTEGRRVLLPALTQALVDGAPRPSDFELPAVPAVTVRKAS